MVVWLGRRNALRVSWVLHVVAMAFLGVLTWSMAASSFADRPVWAAAAWLGFAGTVVLLWLEQRWAEDVNLAFFKTNVAVGFVVLATMLALRMATGGFSAWPDS
jgi:cytochrome bd-type quinol oxidase subunit 2